MTHYENRMVSDRDQKRTHYAYESAYENRMMNERIYQKDAKGAVVTKPGKVDGDSKWKKATPVIQRWQIPLARKKLELEAIK